MPTSADDRARKRVTRAERDVRMANRAAHALGASHSGDPESWRRARGRGWSAAETLRHLALTASSVVEQLRVVAAQGALTRPSARSVGQATRLRFALTTWRLPENLGVLPATDPGGVVMTATDLEQAHVAWTASFVGLLHEHTPAFLANVRWAHPSYGDMDPMEWARFLRIYFRQHELRLMAR